MSPELKHVWCDVTQTLYPKVALKLKVLNRIISKDTTLQSPTATPIPLLQLEYPNIFLDTFFFQALDVYPADASVPPSPLPDTEIDRHPARGVKPHMQLARNLLKPQYARNQSSAGAFMSVS